MSTIKKLQAENFKRIKAVEIEANGESVVIGGNNAQGKSSVLDAIQAAIAGRKGVKEIPRPIHDGASKAKVVLELDDLVIERTWSASGTQLKVKPKGTNATMNSPQAVLDKLIGSLSFDPLEFAEAEPKKQVAVLIDLIGRERFDQLAQDRRTNYDERTEVSRMVKRYQAELAGLPETEAVEKVDVAETVELLQQVEQKARLRARWQEIENDILALREEQQVIVTSAASLPDGDPQALREAIADAGKTNELAAAHGRRVEVQSLLEAETATVTALTERIQKIDQDRANLIASAPLPIPGLAFDDEGVVYNGVPFVQASAAERLKVSTAMAMALNPELKVICIRDASLLDSSSTAALHAMAAEHGYQLFLEVVGEGEVGIIIEDGMVKER